MSSVKRLPDPITSDTFAAAWDYVAVKYRVAKRRVWIERVVSFFGNYLFLAMMLLLVYCGAAYMNVELLQPWLMRLKPVWQLRLQLEEYLQSIGMSSLQQLFVGITAVYVVPLCVCAVLTVLVMLLYHPRKPAQTQEAENKKAEKLLELGKKAKSLSRKSGNQETTCAILPN